MKLDPAKQWALRIMACAVSDTRNEAVNDAVSRVTRVRLEMIERLREMIETLEVTTDHKEIPKSGTEALSGVMREAFTICINELEKEVHSACKEEDGSLQNEV